DLLGHLGGDFTLRELAAFVKDGIRREELFARYGGEEFIVVLPETDYERALLVGERIRQLVESHLFQYDGESYQVTVSLGISVTQGTEPLTPQELIRRADVKMYQAKREGS